MQSLNSVVVALGLLLATFVAASSLNTDGFSHPDWTDQHADRREIADEEAVSFIVALKLPEPDKLREHLLRVSDPRHSDYGRYLTLDSLRKQYAPNPSIVELVASHFTTAIADSSVETSLSGDMLRVRAHASAVEAGLRTRLRWFKRTSSSSSSAESHAALRAVEPISLPASVSQHVAFLSLNSHVAVPSPHQRRSALASRQDDDTATVSVASRGNEEAVLAFSPTCSDGQPNWQSPPCPNDGLALQVQVTAHANDRSDPRELLREPLYFQLPFGSLVCLDSSTAQLCQSSSDTSSSCLCFAKLGPLPKYQQLRANLLVVDASSGDASATNEAASTTLFALTDVATVPFLKRLYNIPGGLRVPSGSAATQSVAEFYGEFYSNADLAAFLQLSGLPNDAIPDDHVFGNLPNNQSNPGGEAQLDVEYMMGIAPGAPIYFYSIGDLNPYDSDNEGFLTYLFIVGNQSNPPLVHSLSYGDIEGVVFNQSIPGASDYAARCDQEFMKMGLRGLTVVFSSGDDGSPNFIIRDDEEKACSQAWPAWPASSPYVTTVGATPLSSAYIPLCQHQYASVLPTEVALEVECTGVQEVVCSALFGGVITSGGGFSNVYDRSEVPWQENVVQNYLSIAPNLPSAGFFNRQGRAYPDVTAYGSNYFVYLDSKIIRESGTSASAPVFGAMVTQWNHLRLANGQSPLGFIAPLLYSLAKSNPEAFNDITVGDIACSVGYSMETVACCDQSFEAVAGWDPASGLGSPNFQTIAQLILQSSDDDDDDSHETAALAIAIIGIVLAVFCLLLTAYLFKVRGD